MDLDGDGIETIGAKAGAYFDHAGDGFAEQTGWVGADDGLLVWDRNSDGRINDGTELFGSETVLSDGTKAADGYQALAELDTNLDGKIDISDAAFADLKVWQDLDGDGYSSTGELFSLTDAGVQAINTGATSSTYTDPAGNAHKLTGTFTKTDGTTGATADVWFQTDPLYTIQEDYLAVPADIAALPDLRGYGNVYDLQQAMVRDTSGTLKTLVQNFIVETDRTNRNTLFEQILFKWTGVDAVNPSSRGSYIDARRLAFMEKLFGRGFVGSDGSPDPAYNTGPLLDQAYVGVSETFYAQTMAQTHLKSLYDLITYSWDSTTQSIKGDLTAVITAVNTSLQADPTAGKRLLAEFTRTIKGLQAEATFGATAFRDTFAAQSLELGILADAAAHVHGTQSNETLAGSAANNYIVGYDGNDTITDAGGNNLFDGGAGDDVITLQAPREGIGSPSQHNLFDGGIGNDRFYSGITADTYVFHRGDGQDFVNDYDTGLLGATDTLSFGAGINPTDIALSRTGDSLVLDVADPGNPAAVDRVTIENWFYHPFYNIEVVAFADGTVWGAADLRARFAPYTIYAYARGTGPRTIYDYDWAQTDVDTIAFGAGIAAADVRLQKVGADLVVTVGDPANPGANDRLTLERWFANPVYNLHTIAFANGTVWGMDEFHARITTGSDAAETFDGWDNLALTYHALGGNDTVNAQGADDIIYGGDGNDTLRDTGGNNLIDGGAGNDAITLTGSGTNTVYGGTGDDTINITGTSGANAVYAGDGNDTVGIIWNTDNILNGGAGDDYLLVWRVGDGSPVYHNTFIGGTGNDYLLGGASTDTYIFNRGDGQDLVNDHDWNEQGAADTIAFGAGISQSDLAVSRDGDHLLVQITDPANPEATDQITVQYWYADPSHHRIEQFAFADGTSLTGNQIEALIPVPPPPPPGVTYGTEGADTLNTGTNNDTVYGLGGNDTIRDTGGSNTVDAGAGNDWIWVEGSGINTVLGGDGNDTVQVSFDADSTLEGGAGDDTLLVHRTGGSAAHRNTFTGGTGNDWLYGGAAADTYLFNRGDGADWINDYDYGAQGANDLLAFGAGINPLDLVFSRNGDHLKLTVHGSTDSVDVQWWYADPTHHHVETVQAGNGSTLVDTQVEQLIQAMATFGAQNGGISWDQAIDQRPDDVQAILAANWMPSGG